MKNQNPEDYPILTYDTLEEIAQAMCPCCDQPFTPYMPPDLTGKCHTGPVFVSYYDGYLFLACGKCKKPIARIAVEQPQGFSA